MKTDDELAQPSDSEHEAEVKSESDENPAETEEKEQAKHYSMKLTDKDRRRLRRESRAAARHRKREKKPSEPFEKQLKDAIKDANKLAKTQRRKTADAEDRPKLGSRAFEDLPTAAIVQLPASALRAQTQKINPVKDRFLSVQRRGLIEKRDPAK